MYILYLEQLVHAILEYIFQVMIIKIKIRTKRVIRIINII